MKSVLCVFMVALLASGCNASTEERQRSPEEEARSPLEVVNLRMNAYNDHDLDALLSTYSDDVEIFTYPSRSLGRGREHVKELFSDLFRDETLRVDIHHQIAKDGYVINHETVLSSGAKTEYVSIYEVRDGLIKSVRFVRD